LDKDRADVEFVELRLVRPQVEHQPVLALVQVDQLAELGPEVALAALELAPVEQEVAQVEQEAWRDLVEGEHLEDGQGPHQVEGVQQVGRVPFSQIGTQEGSQVPQC
jgi:hypothetical protein